MPSLSHWALLTIRRSPARDTPYSISVVGRFMRNTTSWSLTIFTSSTLRQNPASVAVASGRSIMEWEWTTSFAVNWPNP